MQITTGLPHSAYSRAVEATEVTTEGECRVLLCLRRYLTLRELARDYDTSSIAQPIN